MNDLANHSIHTLKRESRIPNINRLVPLQLVGYVDHFIERDEEEGFWEVISKLILVSKEDYSFIPRLRIK